MALLVAPAADDALVVAAPEMMRYIEPPIAIFLTKKHVGDSKRASVSDGWRLLFEFLAVNGDLDIEWLDLKRVCFIPTHPLKGFMK